MRSLLPILFPFTIMYMGSSLPLPFVVHMLHTMPEVTQNIYIGDVHLSLLKFMLAISILSFPLGQLIGTSVWHTLSQKYNNSIRCPFIICILSSGIAYLITAIGLYSNLIYLFIMGQFLSGFFTCVSIIRSILLNMFEDKPAKALGIVDAALTMGYILGIIVGGFFINLSSQNKQEFYIPFVFSFTMTIVGFFLYYKASSQFSSSQYCNSSLSLNKKEKPHFSFIIVILLYTISIDGFYRFMPIFLSHKWGVEPHNIAIYTFIFAIILIIFDAFLLEKIEKRVSVKNILLVSMSITSLSYLLIAFSYNFSLTILASLMLVPCISMSTNFLAALYAKWHSNIPNTKKMVYYTNYRKSGDVIMSLVGAVVLVVSARLLFLLFAILCLVSLLYISEFTKNKKTDHKHIN